MNEGSSLCTHTLLSKGPTPLATILSGLTIRRGLAYVGRMLHNTCDVRLPPAERDPVRQVPFLFCHKYGHCANNQIIWCAGTQIHEYLHGEWPDRDQVTAIFKISIGSTGLGHRT